MMARLAVLLLGLCAPTSAGERVQFVFRGIDREHSMAMLEPSVCPSVGVQVESGGRTLERNHVLSCTTQERIRVLGGKDGQDFALSELVLACDGGQTLVVKGIQFVRYDGK